ncbi:hypothetical protein IKG10_03040 [Candidatus Saccharibacteria bacterium]|nr:hypothetical protein [Candidatus Saccharibacteria bacterium]
MKKAIAITALFLAAFIVLTWTNNANAVTCQDIQSGNVVNGSLKRACNAKVRTGALWLSGNSSSEYLWPGASYDTNKGKVTVYLRGAIICGIHCEGPSQATYVKLVRGSNYIGGASIDNYENYGAFSGVPTSFLRPEAKRNGGSITASAYAITLDLDKMKELEGNNYTIKNGRRLYQLDIQAYRCMQGTYPSMGSTYCDSDTVKLDVSVPLSKYTLSAYAVTTNGDNLNNGSPIDSKTVNETSTASVTRTSISDYTFKGWATTKENAKKGTYFITTNTGAAAYLSGSSSPKETYNIKSLTKNSTIYAVYEHKSFQANATVAGSSTAYSAEDKSINKNVNCNNITKGCSVNFSFNMKRIAGAGATTYSILTKPVGETKYRNVKANQSFNPKSNNSAQQVGETYKGTIKPGESVCYRIVFHPYGKYNAETTKSATACVYGIATLNSGISLNVERNDLEQTQGTIFVKPGDIIKLIGSYTPLAQYVVGLKPKELIVGSKTDTSSGAIETRFKKLTGSDWVNEFAIQFKNNCKKTVPGVPGSTNSLFDSVFCEIDSGDVGNSFTAIAKTNFSSGRISPKSSKIGYNSSVGFSATVDPSSISSAKSIIVPYNFVNTTNVESCDKAADPSCGNKAVTLYSGESANIYFRYIVNPKENELTTNSKSEKYATSVSNPKWKIRICVVSTNECTETSEESEASINISTDDMYTGKSSQKSTSVVIPDVPAGTEIRVYSAVYPANSGADDNYTEPEGNKDWAWSSPKSFYVAKRPSLQVWGGNIYSSGTINTSITKKKKYFNPDSASEDKMDTGTFIFGSWGELGIISGGEVNGLASGAGYANQLGVSKTDYCFVSTLSFANNNCSSGTTGLLGISSSFTKLDDDKNTVIEKLTNNAENITEYSNIDALPEEINENSGIILIQNKSGEINITKSILYNGSYTSLETIPKVVIYAKNININCEVTRIDALLIATDTVNTCSDISKNEENSEVDWNDKKASTQLRVNGAIITNKLEANRTYGAARGANSGIPAEIINFDPSLYLWGKNETKTDSNSAFTSVYQHELSPRL